MCRLPGARRRARNDLIGPHAPNACSSACLGHHYLPTPVCRCRSSRKAPATATRRHSGRPHTPAVLIVISADVAEVSSKGLHGQRAGDFPTPPLDDDTCGGDGGAQPSFRHLGTFPVFLAAQFLGVVWGVMGNCISISTSHRMLLQRGGGDAEGSKCKDICHQDSAASRGTGTMAHPRATLRSTTRTSLKGTEGKQRSLFFPIVGDLVKGCRERGLCILYRLYHRGARRSNPLTPLKVLSWGLGMESSLPSPLLPIH